MLSNASGSTALMFSVTDVYLHLKLTGAIYSSMLLKAQKHKQHAGFLFTSHDLNTDAGVRGLDPVKRPSDIKSARACTFIICTIYACREEHNGGVCADEEEKKRKTTRAGVMDLQYMSYVPPGANISQSLSALLRFT